VTRFAKSGKPSNTYAKSSDVSGIERACVEARVYEVNATLADTTTPVSPEHAERRLKARAEIVVDVPKQEAPPDA